MDVPKRLRFVSEAYGSSRELPQLARDLGFRVEVYASAADFIAYLDQLPSLDDGTLSASEFAECFWRRYSPVIVDILTDPRALPEAAKAILARDAGIPVIVIAAQSSLLTISECSQGGVEAVLIGTEDVKKRFWPLIASVQARLERMLKMMTLASTA